MIYIHITIIQFIYDFFYLGMWLLVLNCIHPYRFSRPITYLIEVVWVLLCSYSLRCLPFMSVLRVTIGYLSFFSVCLLLYKAPWLKVMFTSAMVLLLALTNEIIGAALYYPPEALAGTPELLSVRGQLLFYGPNLVTGALLFLLFYVLVNRIKFRLEKRDWLLFALFPVSQYMLMYGWLDAIRTSGDEERIIFFTVAMFASVLADTALFLSIRRISQRAQLRAENEQLTLQVEAQEKHYADLTAQYESIRRMRHDIANHLSTMQSLLESRRSGEAAAYLSELKANSYDTTLGICEHPVVDAFLHNKIEAAKAAGVEIKARVSLHAKLPVSNVDLIRAFGNLLDNAVEACAGLDNARVELTCAQLSGCLVIFTENPIPKESPKKSRRIPVLERGVGGRVLKALADKYDGNLNQVQQDGVYRAELILNLQ